MSHTATTPSPFLGFLPPSHGNTIPISGEHLNRRNRHARRVGTNEIRRPKHRLLPKTLRKHVPAQPISERTPTLWPSGSCRHISPKVRQSSIPVTTRRISLAPPSTSKSLMPLRSPMIFPVGATTMSPEETRSPAKLPSILSARPHSRDPLS